MKWNCSIFVLLIGSQNSFVAGHFGDVALKIVEKVLGARNDNCANNNYKHDPSLSSNMDGYFYILYTSVAFASNEIFKYYPKGNNNVIARTTNDSECCRTLNFTLGEEYNVYTIGNDEDCSKKIIDIPAQQKLIDSNTDLSDGSYCLLLWICRKSREGVHVLCDKRMVSQEQTEWIHKQYDEIGLKPLKVEQSTDHKEGKCFKE